MDSYNNQKLIIINNILMYLSTKRPVFNRVKTVLRLEDVKKLNTLGISITKVKDVDFYKRMSSKNNLLHDVIKTNHMIFKSVNHPAIKLEQKRRFPLTENECREYFEAKRKVIENYLGDVR